MDKIFFTGIAGAGMSKLAILYNSMGFKVEGSDIKYSKNVKTLEERGIKVYLNHSASHINKDIKKLVFSSAVSSNNVELTEAQKLGIPVVKRGKALADVVSQYKTIVVSGTHGKTTTTSIIGHILKNSGKEANVYIGGEDEEFNSFKKDAEYFVIESDESDGSFLLLNPDILVVTNIDRDHLGYYGGSFEKLKNAFRSMMDKSKICIVSMDDSNALSVASNVKDKDIFYFSIKDHRADIYADNILYEKNGTYFKVANLVKKEVFFPMFGDKNVSNTLAALLVVERLGLDLETASDSLRNFVPPLRRIEFKGMKNGIILFDDHADHPTEVLATLSALKKHFPNERLIAVYQPHRYSRIKMLDKSELLSPFKLSDVVIVMEIYAAFEKPIPGINGKNIYQWVKKTYSDRDVFFAPGKGDVLTILKKILKKGDLVVLLGPGDIEELSSPLLRAL